MMIIVIMSINHVLSSLSMLQVSCQIAGCVCFIDRDTFSHFLAAALRFCKRTPDTDSAFKLYLPSQCTTSRPMHLPHINPGPRSQTAEMGSLRSKFIKPRPAQICQRPNRAPPPWNSAGRIQYAVCVRAYALCTRTQRVRRGDSETKTRRRLGARARRAARIRHPVWNVELFKLCALHCVRVYGLCARTQRSARAWRAAV
jgi:hypothetical protein